MADTAPRTLRVAAIYDRSAGLGDVVLDPAVARGTRRPRRDAVFVAGGRGAALARRYAAPPAAALTRAEYLDTVEADEQRESWAVWLIVGLAAAFATLALINTAAMATGERRDELATIRLLGGTGGQAMRMIALELVADRAGGAGRRGRHRRRRDARRAAMACVASSSSCPAALVGGRWRAVPRPRPGGGGGERAARVARLRGGGDARARVASRR